ncbi:ABC transporter permease subunit [Vibrio parahaemolyticus]|nr:ABC transporter permease subunit [Vibrio parahaemolyticus]ELM4063275.1 ABC transporter permease subunit [Vibrio parahaemolyticus]
MNFITDNKLPLGQWMETGVDWLTINASGFFDAISITLETIIIFAIAAPIRLTYLGIIKVPEELLEAGKAFGASRMKLLFKVELPAALPSIMAGVTQCIMLSLSMVVIAALVGADGLGKPVVRALNTVNISQGFEAGLAIVLVAIILDRLCKAPNQKEA